MEEMPWLSIVPSPLVRVIPIGQTVEAAGVTVELLAIEVRERGAVLYWRARADRELPLQVAEVSVVDDHGTAYRVDPGGGGGNFRSWEGQTFARPAPPADARLTIVLDTFRQDPRTLMTGGPPMGPVHGPWRFDVEPPSSDTLAR